MSVLRPFTNKLSHKIKQTLKTLLYFTIAIALLLQVVSSAFFVNPTAAAEQPTAAIKRERDTETRAAWQRPQTEAIQFPENSSMLPQQNVATFVAADNQAAALAPPLPFPSGNNNLGRTYKDTNNPEDHPGRHFAGPVNLINGNFYLTTGDHFFVGAGLSVQFARSYNSLPSNIPTILPNVMGNGWTHSYDAAVILDLGPQLFIRNGDGSIHEYNFNGVSWDPPPGIFRELQHNLGVPTDPYVLRHKSGLVERFAPLASTTPGRLQVIKDRNGNTIELQYNVGGFLEAIIDAATGHQLQIAYDTSNRIAKITDPIGRETVYTYDTSNNLTQVDYPEGTQAAYSYDGLNRLIRYDDPRQSRGTRQVNTIGYDGVAVDDPVTAVDYGSGVGFELTYNVLVPPPPPGTSATVWIDSLGRTNKILYDLGTFNIMEDGTFFASCGCFQGQGYQYNANHLLQFKVDALGNSTQYAYDSQGNMLFVQDPLGNPMGFEYDLLFNVPLTSTNAAGDKITYTYDTNGNLLQENHPLGRSINYTYDSAGNLLTQTDPEGKITEYAYDLQGNLRVVTDTASFVTKFEYDDIGRVSDKVDPLGNQTTYEYDALDRLVRVTDPIGGNTDYQYDLRSNLKVLTDTNGFAISHTYDSLDRLLSVTDALGNSTGYIYDDGNQLVERTDPNGNTTKYVYDEVGRMLERTAGPRTDKFIYDAAGRLTFMTDGDFTTELVYNGNNLVTDRILNHPAFSSPTTVNYTYDALGNRTTATLDDGTTSWTTTYTYDALSRLIKTTDQNGREWDTVYNLNDQRLSLTLPDGSHVEYDYDANDNLIRKEHFDPANVSERKYLYTYDPLRNILTEDDNGQPYSFVYDALSRADSTVTPFGNVTFGYDAVGNRTLVDGPEGPNTFVYDPGNHLLNSNDTTYSYDAMGARTQDVGPAGTRIFTYDGEMRLETVGLLDEGFLLELDYDPLGALVRKQDSNGNTTFFLQGDGRLEAELDSAGDLERVLTIDTEIVAMDLVSAGPPITVDFHRDGRNRVRWVTDSTGDLIAEYSGDPTEDNANFYNPIRLEGLYFFPEIGFYYLGDGQFWDPITGLLLFRYWPWVFWPFNPYHPLIPLFRYWPWAWPWPSPWGFPWPTPWPFLWPWPGVWIRPFLIWPMWPWPSMPYLPWWWWNHWWGWWSWGHWWWWYPWHWWNAWWYWGWWYWGWWGWHWWIWHWWWPWWWWWPCWWIGGWWWWHWHWWWWNWWWWRWWWWWPPPPPPPPPPLPRPPDYGDASDPLYASLLINNGARHRNPALEWLGPAVDREFNAKITDLDLFDDGVTVDLLAQIVTFTATTSGSAGRYTAAAPLHVHGWIDWGNDGIWHPGDLILNWSGYPGDGTWVLGDASVTVSVPFIAPPTPWPPMMWSRFRLDYAQNLESPVGAATYGEVEDYLLGVPLAVAPLLTISNPSGTIAQLDWTYHTPNCWYQVHKDSAPYFAPSGGTLQSTLPGLTLTTQFPTDVGSPLANNYYLIRALNCSVDTAVSNRVGEFDFTIVPGVP
ncbi:MAG: RHS repeat protein [Anaerolineales bacterium]|nr:RHS repeat protein [Anaerolineales bacterium]